MIKLDDLDSVTSIIHGDGSPMTGCQLSVEEALAWVRAAYPNKPHCLVRDWRWLDLDIPVDDHEFLEQRGQQPAALYANNVVFDSRSRWAPGNWVRSTLLHRYDEKGAFVTLNTVYVLMGEGIKQKTTVDAFQSIF